MSQPQNPQDPSQPPSSQPPPSQAPQWNPPPTPPGGPQAPQWNPPPSMSKQPPAAQYPPPPQTAAGGLPYAPPPTPGYAAAPTPPEGYYFDPASGLTLPNATELAPVGRRIGQYFLDLLLLIVTLFIGYIVWSLIIWSRGQTPAMQVLHMRCYRPEHGRAAHWGYMALRQIIGGFVEGLFAGIVFLVSSIMMITSNDHKAIHDHIAGTVVLNDPMDVLAPR